MLQIKGFTPYILVLFLNAMTDLGHKIIIQNTVFKIYNGSEQIILTAIINSFILLPYILLFTPAGFISDKYPKEKVMRISSFFAVIVTLMITFAYYFGFFWIAFGLTLLLATQSAIYSPAKYGYIRELLGDEKTAIGNSWVQATTIVAILGGTFFYSLLFESLLNEYVTKEEIIKFMTPVGVLLFVSSLIELSLAFKLPNIKKVDHKKIFNIKFYLSGKYKKETIESVINNSKIFKAIILLSLFFAISQVILVIFGAFIKSNLNEINTVIVQGLMALSGVGIIIGSFIAGKLSAKSFELGIVPIGFLGIFIAILSIPMIDNIYIFAISFLIFGIMGGLVIVPLNTVIQIKSPSNLLGSVLASNNFIQNIFMISFLVLTTFFAYFNYNEIYIFYILSGVSILGILLSLKNYFKNFMFFMLKLIFKIKYSIIKINSKNLLQIETQSSKHGILFISNHVSWIDWAILIISIKSIRNKNLVFLMEKHIFEKNNFLKRFLLLFDVMPISPKDFQKAFINTADVLKSGNDVVIFAEGHITYNGQMSDIKRGYTKIIELLSENDKKNVSIVPVYLEGLWGSRFSRATKTTQKLNRRSCRRKIFVSFGNSMLANKTAEIQPENIAQSLREASIFAWEKYISQMDTLPNEWIRQSKKEPNKKIIFDATMDTELTNIKFMTAVFLFAKLIKKLSPEQNVGTILPASSGTAITNMAILYLNKTIVNLNFTASQDVIISSMKTASVQTIYTSRKFINILKDKNIHLDEVLQNANIYYLEDLKNDLKPATKLLTFLKAKFLPTSLLKLKYQNIDKLEKPATIIFSSGSESLPKGIVLTHRNILTNVVQAQHLLNFIESDKIFSMLPVFHSFGFTVTTMLPLLKSIPMVTFGNPTDATSIAKIVKKYKPTTIFGTSTIYRIYLKSPRVKPEDFESFRYVIAGAEKLNPKVKEGFEEKFSKTILEGYGVTETSPVSGVNLPTFNKNDFAVGTKHGTVGKALVGTIYKIIDPETLEVLPTETDGMIAIAGHQVMQGYLNNQEKTDSVVFVKNGIRYYMTGDKGHLDKDGFLTIIDRYSRFIKIGGEMVSLTSATHHIEEALNNSKIDLKQDLEILLVGINDSKKGEKIVMLINQEIHNLKNILLEQKLNTFYMPHDVFVIDEIPMLGAGKPNFTLGKKIALELLSK